MKLRNLIALAALPIFLISCGPDFFMLEGDTKPEIKADTDKATLVILRSSSYGAGIIIDDYIDNKFIGQTQKKCFFVTKVDPGSRYLVGSTESTPVAKLNLEAGKIYYVHQQIVPGVWSPRSIFTPSTVEFFTEQLPELEYYSLMSDKELPTMEEEEYKEACAEFDKDVQEDPSKNKEFLEMKGY